MFLFSLLACAPEPADLVIQVECTTDAEPEPEPVETGIRPGTIETGGAEHDTGPADTDTDTD